MSSPVIDPTNPEVAILDDGTLAMAVRWFPVYHRIPTAAELESAPIVAFAAIPSLGTTEDQR